uniref:Transcription repressor n=1 Tax=Kalanchoe fedtschenkoi TaxID=63787 RepID=A0A7N0ZS71_KALFE
MGNPKFRLSSIIPALWLSTPKSPQPPTPRPRRPQPGDDKSPPVRTFDDMLLHSSSSRSFRTDGQPGRRPRVHKSANSCEILCKCCHGVRWLKVKSRRMNDGAQKTAGGPSSSCSSRSFGSENRRRLGLSESSVTVVKSSANPESDFKESMVEMIVENNITDLEGLEELLVSYLVLNSDEFHQVIVSVFKEIVVPLFKKQKMFGSLRNL